MRYGVWFTVKFGIIQFVAAFRTKDEAEAFAGVYAAKTGRDTVVRRAA